MLDQPDAGGVTTFQGGEAAMRASVNVQGGLRGLGVLNLVVGASLGAVGLLVLGLTLSARAPDAASPLVLMAGAAMWVAAGALLFSGASPAKSAASMLLAALCGLAYTSLCLTTLKLTEVRHLDPAALAVLVPPGVISLLGLAEAAYLWVSGRARA
jgi:hypothetical protein